MKLVKNKRKWLHLEFETSEHGAFILNYMQYILDKNDYGYRLSFGRLDIFFENLLSEKEWEKLVEYLFDEEDQEDFLQKKGEYTHFFFSFGPLV